MKPAAKPKIKTVNMVFFGMLNNMPNPAAAIPDQMAASSKSNRVVCFLI
jgi:hypothetical protein